MTVCSIVPFLLVIEELKTKLLSILQDLQCTSRSNSKWAGEAFSQRQGDWMFVGEWNWSFKLKMKADILMTLERKISFSNCEGHLTSVFIFLLCTEGMSKKHFSYTIVKFAILHELILYLKSVIILRSYHFHLSFF